MTENMLDRDAQEGINAFIEKRVPVWRDGEEHNCLSLMWIWIKPSEFSALTP